jgi:hypothetical protein
MKTYGQWKDSSTMALDKVEWSISRSGRFAYGKELLVIIGQKAGWAPEPVWALWRSEKPLDTTED